jgi:cell division protein FtsW (lipid II flippase)
VQKNSAISDHNARPGNYQVKLLILAAIFLFIYSIVLTLSLSVRSHSLDVDYKWNHWVGYFTWLIGFFLLSKIISKRTFNFDPFILPIIALLSGWGLLTIWRLDEALGLKQTLWLFLSLGLVSAGIYFPGLLKFLQRYKYIWLLLGIIITFLTLFIGINPSGSGPRLWIGIKDFFFQPSEPLKLLLIIFLAAFFSDGRAFKIKYFQYILPTLIVGLLTIILLISQRDLGTAFIFIFIYSTILIATTFRKRLIWLIPLILGVVSIFAYFFLDIVKLRIDMWLDPWSYSSTSAYQTVQAMIAIASGGMFGSGPGLGSPGLVPVAISDFIFTTISEEMGLLGSIVLILLFQLYSIRTLKISAGSTNLFHRYLSLGISTYFSIQAILIIGGNLGVLPLTGVTLPFVSYGGSSLITNFLCLLILILIKTSEEEPDLSITNNRSIMNLGMIFSFAFLIMIFANTYISFFQRTSLIQRSDNPRWIVYDRWIPRGDILDQKGKPIVTTIGEPGSFSRFFNYIPLSPVIGYSNPIFGQTNLEESLYPYLRGLDGVSFSEIWWHQKLYNQPPEGLDLRLSIDLSYQSKTDALLDSTTGAVVLLNAETGEIYAISSYPYFDANSLDSDWNKLITDQTAPLLNRSTQASYTLGTASSPLLIPAYLSTSAFNLTDLSFSNRIDYSCLSTAKGAQSQVKGIQFRCLMAIRQLSELVSTDTLIDTLAAFGLFDPPNIQLPVNEPSPVPDKFEDTLLYLSEIKGLHVSPLQMALVSATLTNNGILPQPRIVNSYQNKSAQWITFPNSAEPMQVMDPTLANQVISILQSGNDPFWFSAGKSTSSDKTVTSWFLGGTMPGWQGTPLAIAIALETDDVSKAIAIGRELLINSTPN